MTLIPDDKAIKPSIVDEMARAIGNWCTCPAQEPYEPDHPPCECADRAHAAAAVVARRLREMGFTGKCGPHYWQWQGGRCPIDALLVGLEGK